jgi:hypothetical protein
MFRLYNHLQAENILARITQLTAGAMKNKVLCILLLCSSSRAPTFRATYCLHLQDRRVRQERASRSLFYIFFVSFSGFLLDSFLVLEDGSDMMVRNIRLCTKYTTSLSEDLILQFSELCNYSRPTLLILVPRSPSLFCPL